MNHDTIHIKVIGGTVIMTIGLCINEISFVPDPELIGKRIRVGEAAEKYGIGQRTLSGWAEKGIIKVIEQANRLLILDEATVAKAAGIFLEASKFHNKYKAGWILKQHING